MHTIKILKCKPMCAHKPLLFSLAVFVFTVLVGVPQVSRADTNPNIPQCPRFEKAGLYWANPDPYRNTFNQTLPKMDMTGDILIANYPGIFMQDGGTYSFPFHILSFGYVVIAGTNCSKTKGDLYFLPKDSSARQFVTSFHGAGDIFRGSPYSPPDITYFQWKKSGQYELDIQEKNSDTGTYALTKTIHFVATNTDDPCSTPNSCFDNVLFIPGTEASRLYYKDGFGEHQVWEPDFYTDIPYLEMNQDGTSKHTLYTKDIIGSLYGNTTVEKKIALQYLNRDGVQVYGNFEKFMNGLVASSTIKQWSAYPYDWRYSADDIVNNGTLTKMPDGTLKRVYLEKEIESLASSSPTGKVMIVAHSNGGLVAKELLQKLSNDGKLKLVDKFVMVATPQWGTPEAIGVLLHGDGQTQAHGLLMSGTKTRRVTKTMPGAYDLLPSWEYFQQINIPVITIDANGSATNDLAKAFGTKISYFTEFANFLEHGFGYFPAPQDTDTALRTPIALSKKLIDKAKDMHFLIDVATRWSDLYGIDVTAIAGWGQNTIKTLAYSTGQKTICTNLTADVINAFEPPCRTYYYLEHTPVTTPGGDGTVVYQSAVGNIIHELFFNIKNFDKKFIRTVVHQNITSAPPIQNVIKDILTNKKVQKTNYITKTKPSSDETSPEIRISSHSPVNILITSANGEQSGVVHIPGTDFSGTKMDIPGSSVQVFDTEEYVSLPKNGNYKVVARGHGNGTATILIETIAQDGTASTTNTFAEIPTTASSTITFSVSKGQPTAPIIDLTGTGKHTFTIPVGNDPLAYVLYMKNAIKEMNLSRGEHFVINAKLSVIEMQIKSSKETSRFFRKVWRGHRPYGKLSTWRNKQIKFELAVLARYINHQFSLSARIDKNKDMRSHRHFARYNMQPHISATQAETIIDMINRLKNLI